MEILVLGLMLFLLTHLTPSFFKVRNSIVASVGAKPYKLVFSIISLISMVMIVYGFREAGSEHFYVPPQWGHIATMILMLPAIYLFMSNSVGSVPSSAQAITAHPLSWGVVLWSMGHLLSNGEASSVLMFTAFLVVGVSSILSGKKRGLKPRKDKRPPFSKELFFLLAAGGVYVVLILAHGYISGVKLISA